MPTLRRRRIARRAMMALAGCVLLIAWYVGAWLAVSRAEHDGIVSKATAQRIRPVFVPLISYCDQEWPASGLLRGLWWRFNPLEPLVEFNGKIIGYIGPVSQLAPRRTTRREEIE